MGSNELAETLEDGVHREPGLLRRRNQKPFDLLIGVAPPDLERPSLQPGGGEQFLPCARREPCLREQFHFLEDQSVHHAHPANAPISSARRIGSKGLAMIPSAPRAVSLR